MAPPHASVKEHFRKQLQGQLVVGQAQRVSQTDQHALSKREKSHSLQPSGKTKPVTTLKPGSSILPHQKSILPMRSKHAVTSSEIPKTKHANVGTHPSSFSSKGTTEVLDSKEKASAANMKGQRPPIKPFKPEPDNSSPKISADLCQAHPVFTSSHGGEGAYYAMTFAFLNGEYAKVPDRPWGFEGIRHPKKQRGATTPF